MALGQPCSSIAPDTAHRGLGTVRTLLQPQSQEGSQPLQRSRPMEERCGDISSWGQGRERKGEAGEEKWGPGWSREERKDGGPAGVGKKASCASLRP